MSKTSHTGTSLEDQDGQTEDAFELVTYGKGGTFSPFDVEKMSTLTELEDLEPRRHPLAAGS